MRELATAIAALVTTTACSGTVVEVTVSVRESVTAVTDLTDLEIIARNGSDRIDRRFAVDGREFPLSFTITPEGRSGEIEIEIAATNAAGRVSAAATVRGQIEDGETTALAARLDPADFVVNANTDGGQRLAFRPARNGRQIAATASGGFATTFVNDCQQTVSCDVFVRIFDGEGSPVSDEGSANVADVSEPRVPAIAASSGGQLAVVWETDETITFSTLAADGSVQMADLDATPAEVEDPFDPAVASAGGSRFVLVWYQEFVDSENPAGLYQATYDGAALSVPVMVRDQPSGIKTRSPCATRLGTSTAIMFAEDDALRLRIDTDGVLGPELVLKSYVAGATVYGPTAAASGDDLVVAWGASVPGDPDLDPGGQLIGTFRADGTAINEVLLESSAAAATDKPAVAVDGDGRIGAAWHQCDSSGDGDGCGIFVQLFDPTLTELTRAVRVNTTTAGDQLEPAIAATGDGFALVWTDFSGEPPDDSSASVRGRVMFTDALLGL